MPSVAGGGGVMVRQTRGEGSYLVGGGEDPSCKGGREG
jgi:hypothetical protein